jgi:hypothetical protein
VIIYYRFFLTDKGVEAFPSVRPMSDRDADAVDGDGEDSGEEAGTGAVAVASPPKWILELERLPKWLQTTDSLPPWTVTIEGRPDRSSLRSDVVYVNRSYEIIGVDNGQYRMSRINLSRGRFSLFRPFVHELSCLSYVLNV